MSKDEFVKKLIISMFQGIVPPYNDEDTANSTIEGYAKNFMKLVNAIIEKMEKEGYMEETQTYTFEGQPIKLTSLTPSPHSCPVCAGTGRVSGPSGTSAGDTYVTCPACHGACVIWG